MSSTSLKHEKVFRDPIHNFIHVNNQLILDLIDTPEFQRLRRVKQLGVASQVFHGAEHSRFGHSLGAYELARQITTNFSKYYSSSDANDGWWNPEENLLTCVAALLHDIGHGAFSHTFEYIFKTNHESYTQQIILGDTNINKILLTVSPDFPNKVASVIAKTYPNPQVVQLISSQIDVDRMDYLLRDAFYTGTSYGMFDIDRIIQTMRPYKDGITFSTAGLHAVEDYVLSRYQMFLQVYFHPVSRGLEVILLHMLQRAKEIYDKAENNDNADLNFLKPLLLPLFSNDFSLQDYLSLDDNVFYTYFIIWKNHPDPILSDLANRFLSRKPLKSIKITDENKNKIGQLSQLVEENGYNTIYYTAENDASDVPYHSYDLNYEKQNFNITFINEFNQIVEISSISPLIEAISGRMSNDKRFYFPKELLNNDVVLLDENRVKFQTLIDSLKKI